MIRDFIDDPKTSSSEIEESFSKKRQNEIINIFNNTILGPVGALTQGENISHQTSEVNIDNSTELNEVKNLINEIKKEIKNIPLRPEMAEEAILYSSVVEKNIAKNVPNKNIVNESLKSIRNILEGCAGSTLASGLISMIDKLLSHA